MGPATQAPPMAGGWGHDMLYKNKTPYGAKLIRVTNIDDDGRIWHEQLDRPQGGYMWKKDFERMYVPVGSGDTCSHCGSIIAHM